MVTVRAVNIGGPSEKSHPLGVSTTGDASLSPKPGIARMEYLLRNFLTFGHYRIEQSIVTGSVTSCLSGAFHCVWWYLVVILGIGCVLNLN